MPNAKQPPSIQFRPGPILATLIAEFASGWKVSENEAAKRLAALAACRLDVGCHRLLVQLAGTFRPPLGDRLDFVQACHHVHTTVATANRTREGLGNPPMTEDETLALVRRTVEEAVRAQQARIRRVQQLQTVKVYRTH